MFRLLLSVAATALVLIPFARADGPIVGATQSWLGVAAPSIGERFVTVSWKGQTTLEAISTRNGAVYGYVSFRGVWGIPAVTLDGSTAGISADARVLVLEDGFGRPATLRKRSSFLVVNARTMSPTRVITLRGDFLVDALSPDGSLLYLIQHVAENDLTRYVVRAYDLRARRLLRRAVADRAQRGWVMRGYPLKRVSSSDGGWVYTLYENDGGYPFVHALDTIYGTAHCIGLPWRGDQGRLWNLRVSLRNGDRTRAFTRMNGTTWLTMDTHTFRLSRPSAPDRRPYRWWWLLLHKT